MAYRLPAATYQSPTRPVRGTVLNTIVEDQWEGHSVRTSDESGVDTDEGTVIYNPVERSVRAGAIPMTNNQPASPTMAIRSTAGAKKASLARRSSSDELYDASDDATDLSDSCPSVRDSLSSRPTSFATDSDRSSVVSCPSKNRNRYPSIVIPSSPSWPLKDHSTVPPTPPPKIPVSPATLSLLPRSVPAINAPPSLDGSSMVSDRLSCNSAPVTPDMHDLPGGQTWDSPRAIRMRRDGGSTRDGSRSGSTSPHRQIVIEQAIDWDEIGSFPQVPGAAALEISPVVPDVHGLGVGEPSTPSDRGVMLSADALHTLHQLASPTRPYDVSSDASIDENAEMREAAEGRSRPRSMEGATPASDLSDYSFSQLSIPSPGGFFSSLKTGTRQTWFPGAGRQSNPPSSTTAENFYNLPWFQPPQVVEKVIEVEDSNTDGPPTARQHPLAPAGGTPDRVGYDATPPAVHQSRCDASPTLNEYDEAYERDLRETAAEHLDRTTSWLAAQLSYLAALRESNPANSMGDWPCPRIDVAAEGKEAVESPRQPVALCLEVKASDGVDGLEEQIREEHIYYQAFLHLAQRRRRRDGFVQGQSRFDAMQASRIALRTEHINRLFGKYEIREPTRPKYSGPMSQNPRATGVLDYTPEQLVFMQSEREQTVLDQVSPSFWVVDALKYLNGGRLLLSDVSKRLATASSSSAGTGQRPKRQLRVLDLGGNTSCDWAWHCAAQFPGVHTYTASTSSEAADTRVTGPPNHRLVIAPQPWRLPFRDHYFDVISARCLHAMLREEKIPGADGIDEYDACLAECHRILKPGGYLEFMVMDADMVHAGPLASAMSVEFGFKLKTRGYDPMPTKSFLRRLRRNQFVDMKRAWMFLPAGSSVDDAPSADEVGIAVTCSAGAEAGDGSADGLLGSTANVASVTGLVGSWMWEQWMLKLQTEMGVPAEDLLRGVAGVIEESRHYDAGWNYLSGWARKPRRKSGARQVITRMPTSETVQIQMAA